MKATKINSFIHALKILFIDLMDPVPRFQFTKRRRKLHRTPGWRAAELKEDCELRHAHVVAVDDFARINELSTSDYSWRIFYWTWRRMHFLFISRARCQHDDVDGVFVRTSEMNPSSHHVGRFCDENGVPFFHRHEVVLNRHLAFHTKQARVAFVQFEIEGFSAG